MSYFIRLLRPQQWLKNLMLFFPLFLSGRVFEVSFVELVYPFVCFSLFSSCCYALNDLYDLELDRAHPQKRLRPLPAGDISKRQAVAVVVVTGGLSFLLSACFVSGLIPWLGAYFLLSLSYTVFLKHLAWVDLIMISLFFLLRLQAGGAAFDVPITLWLYLSVFLLALFLSSGKRLSEIIQLGEKASSHRRTLGLYSQKKLVLVVCFSAISAMLTYTMYCITHQELFYSIPLCGYGLYRYVQRVKKGQDGDPTTSLLKDPQLLVVGVIWCVMVACALY